MFVFLYDCGVSVLVMYSMGFGRSVSLCYNGVKGFVCRYYCVIVVQVIAFVCFFYICGIFPLCINVCLSFGVV
jgi:hypothetical protein